MKALHARRLTNAARSVACLLVFAWTADAQPAPGSATLWLPLDTTLSPTVQPGCEGAAVSAGSPRDASGAREQWRVAQDALLEGDRRRAQQALQQAALRDPFDVRIATDLARVSEELGDTATAVVWSCRLMQHATTPASREEAAGRLSRLLPPRQRLAMTTASRRFSEGIVRARAGDWRASAAAFDDVVRNVPSAPEPLRNRAIVLSMSGDRDRARRDFEQYLVITPRAGDRLVISRAIAALRRPRYRAGVATAAGLMPGGAQFYTGRPAFGVLMLAAVSGAAVTAFVTRTEQRTVDFLDPNGVPAPYIEEYDTRPYRTAGFAAAAALVLTGMVEGAWYASRSARLPALSVGVHSVGRQVGVRVAW